MPMPAGTSSYLRDDNQTINVPTPLGIYQYERSYGSSCAAWDLGLVPYCHGAPPQPASCNHHFCYVDADHCTGTSRYESTFFSGAHYSYGTCGAGFQDSLDWSKLVTETTLRNRTLRFAYPAEMNPWHWRAYQPDTGRWEWDGMMHRFFVRIAIQAGFSIVERNLSSYSLASFSSRWDACTHDVMMGLIDICPTGAQQTPNRMQMAQFTSAIMASNMRLMVRSNPQTLSWDIRDGKDSAWLSFAKPFTYGLWTAIIGLTVFTGLALAFLEGAGVASGAGTVEVPAPGPSSDGTPIRPILEKRLSRNKLVAGATAVAQSQTLKDLMQFKLHRVASRAVEGIRQLGPRLTNFIDKAAMPSIYLAAYGLFVTDVPHRATSIASKAIRLGYAFVIVIVMSSYTANLASTLLQSSVRHRGIQSILDCYSTSRTSAAVCTKVCIAQQYVQAMRENHPSVDTEIFPSSTATFTGLANGNCDA